MAATGREERIEVRATDSPVDGGCSACPSGIAPIFRIRIGITIVCVCGECEPILRAGLRRARDHAERGEDRDKKTL